MWFLYGSYLNNQICYDESTVFGENNNQQRHMIFVPSSSIIFCEIQNSDITIISYKSQWPIQLFKLANKMSRRYVGQKIKREKGMICPIRLQLHKIIISMKPNVLQKIYDFIILSFLYRVIDQSRTCFSKIFQKIISLYKLLHQDKKFLTKYIRYVSFVLFVRL